MSFESERILPVRIPRMAVGIEPNRPLIARLDRFLSGIKWKRPGKILLVRVDAALESGAPHTRANGIMLPKNEFTGTADQLTYVVSHETFHVLTREDGALKERLYGAIGFRRCERIEIPESVSRMRITNPDAVENRHTIAVRYRGEGVEAMPFLRFKSDKFDTRSGFLGNARISTRSRRSTAGRWASSYRRATPAGL